ncbi:hypothetical protein GCM10023321_73110 [Pseudonocardia eucalypti]|uniref:Uncharacterized protein n=1 Tax=Pseudonocardia eucalypti TaxID=648755 RepID=A0ABP9R7R0_9PSEU
MNYLRLADLLRQTLAEHDLDCASLSWLSHTLGVPAVELRTAVKYALHLGICESGAGPVLYCLPRQPMATGFEAVHRNGRMVLRLPGHGLRPPLLISGQHVGPVPEDERAGTLGAGELAYTICRLTLMAGNWLVAASDPTRLLFELIAEGWRHGSTSRLGRGFSIHRASFTEAIATEPATNRIELVTNRHRGGHQLVNLYPIPAVTA